MRSSVGSLRFSFPFPFFTNMWPTLDFGPFYTTSLLSHHPVQWPSSRRQPRLLGPTGSFILTTLAEAEPSACAAASRAPLPPDVAMTSTLPTCTRACCGLHRPVCTPSPPYPFDGDFEPKQNEKNRESNSCQIRNELFKNL
jgi:hypothetical protein